MYPVREIVSSVLWSRYCCSSDANESWQLGEGGCWLGSEGVGCDAVVSLGVVSWLRLYNTDLCGLHFSRARWGSGHSQHNSGLSRGHWHDRPNSSLIQGNAGTVNGSVPGPTVVLLSFARLVCNLRSYGSSRGRELRNRRRTILTGSRATSPSCFVEVRVFAGLALGYSLLWLRLQIRGRIPFS